MRGDLGPKLRSFLSNGASNSTALGLTLVVYYNTCIILAVDVGSVWSSPWSSLPDDDSRVEFLPDFIVTLLARAHDNITNGASWQPVEPSSDGHHGDDEQILSSGVVSAVHGGSDGETPCDS